MFDFSKKDKVKISQVMQELTVISASKNIDVLSFMDDLENADIVCSKLYPAMPFMMRKIVSEDKFTDIYRVHKEVIIKNIKQRLGML